MIRYFKGDKETLESRINQLEIRIQELEHPPKFKVGDTVQFIAKGNLRVITIGRVGKIYQNFGRMYYFNHISGHASLEECVAECDIMLVPSKNTKGRKTMPGLFAGWILLVGYLTGAASYLLFISLLLLPGTIPLYLGYRTIKHLWRKWKCRK